MLSQCFRYASPCAFCFYTKLLMHFPQVSSPKHSRCRCAAGGRARQSCSVAQPYPPQRPSSRPGPGRGRAGLGVGPPRPLRPLKHNHTGVEGRQGRRVSSPSPPPETEPYQGSRNGGAGSICTPSTPTFLIDRLLGLCTYSLRIDVKRLVNLA